MTDETALAQELRYAPYATYLLREKAADALDSLSQRLAAAERERDGYMASAELHYKIRCDQEQNSSNLADQLAAAEAQVKELTKALEEADAICFELIIGPAQIRPTPAMPDLDRALARHRSRTGREEE